MKKQTETFATKEDWVKSLTDKDLMERYNSKLASTRSESACFGMQDLALLNLYEVELYERATKTGRVKKAALPETSIEEIEQLLNERDYELYQLHSPSKVPYDSDPEYVFLSEWLNSRKEAK